MQGARDRGFTLVELMMVIAVVGVLLLVAAPSFRDFIEMQRLRGVSNELVTDIQYLRSEATRRNERMGIVFGGSGSGSGNARVDCYTLFRAPSQFSWINCDCTRPAGAVCTGELRTVKVANSQGVRLRIPSGLPQSFRIDPVSGGVVPQQLEDGTALTSYRIDVSGVRRGQLRTTVSAAGRASTCSPDASVGGVPTCPN